MRQSGSEGNFPVENQIAERGGFWARVGTRASQIVKSFRSDSSGFGIVEAMVSILIISALTVATVETLKSETTSSNAVRSSIVATGLAKQVISQAEVELGSDDATTFPFPFVLNSGSSACNPAPTAQACMPGISGGYNDPYTSTQVMKANGGQTSNGSQQIPFSVTTTAYWECPTNIQVSNVVPIFMVSVSVTSSALSAFGTVTQSTSFAAPGTINTALLGADTGYKCM